MTDTKGLPVKGYKPTQSAENIALVNRAKVLEEKTLRLCDELKAKGSDIDQRFLAVGVTQLQQAFMAINRSVFQPQRIDLDAND